jgi:hypothetical protein
MFGGAGAYGILGSGRASAVTYSWFHSRWAWSLEPRLGVAAARTGSVGLVAAAHYSQRTFAYSGLINYGHLINCGHSWRFFGTFILYLV